MIKEIQRKCASGYLALVILPVLFILDGWFFYEAIQAQSLFMVVSAVLIFIVLLVCCLGFFMVHPNQARVLTLFGTYVGSALETGLRWANPFYAKKAVSLRVRNFDCDPLKVNDSSGNPIEIAAVVVWKVVDSAEAVFEVDDYISFVEIQSEAALRNLATSYPYEAQDDEIALRSNPQQIADELKTEVQDRLEKAGVLVIEARISHLAYAPEIASAMLKRQQAQAIVAARRQIVDGAVGMVKMALTELKEQGVIELDDERKAAIVSNLLVVLCGEENAQPVLNTGSLYN
ncbi:MAG: SPFH domain-containing protein [Xanthomonadales bacterium]|nr:SPFH domain-containing protein [Gammaproteobacteria bacterium]MBT8072509.1 SPFH domain-containing protein [Gammaproteobacteria bacterium]NNK03352.1 SPFH domain-containing protein [Xanthomonadales bacterium]